MPALGYGTVCLCPLSSVHSCCCSVSSLRRTLLSSWWGASMWHSHTSLRCCYLGAVAPRFLATFHLACVVTVQDLVLPGPARLDILLLTDWKLALGPCFLVHSPTIRRHPMGCHGWRFVYFKNTKNLSIHIARIPIGDSPRVHPNIFKMSPPFASSEGYSASGVRYQSDGECVTHLLPHS